MLQCLSFSWDCAKLFIIPFTQWNDIWMSDDNNSHNETPEMMLEFNTNHEHLFQRHVIVSRILSIACPPEWSYQKIPPWQPLSSKPWEDMFHPDSTCDLMISTDWWMTVWKSSSTNVNSWQDLKTMMMVCPLFVKTDITPNCNWPSKRRSSQNTIWCLQQTAIPPNRLNNATVHQHPDRFFTTFTSTKGFVTTSRTPINESEHPNSTGDISHLAICPLKPPPQNTRLYSFGNFSEKWSWTILTSPYERYSFSHTPVKIITTAFISHEAFPQKPDNPP